MPPATAAAARIGLRTLESGAVSAICETANKRRRAVPPCRHGGHFLATDYTPVVRLRASLVRAVTTGVRTGGSRSAAAPQRMICGDPVTRER